jgi:hypothetical protein
MMEVASQITYTSFNIRVSLYPKHQGALMYFYDAAIDRPAAWDASHRMPAALHTAAQESGLTDGVTSGRGTFSEVLCSTTSSKTMTEYNAGHLSFPE